MASTQDAIVRAAQAAHIRTTSAEILQSEEAIYLMSLFPEYRSFFTSLEMMARESAPQAMPVDILVAIEEGVTNNLFAAFFQYRDHPDTRPDHIKRAENTETALKDLEAAVKNPEGLPTISPDLSILAEFEKKRVGAIRMEILAQKAIKAGLFQLNIPADEKNVLSETGVSDLHKRERSSSLLLNALGFSVLGRHAFRKALEISATSSIPMCIDPKVFLLMEKMRDHAAPPQHCKPEERRRMDFLVTHLSDAVTHAREAGLEFKGQPANLDRFRVM